ncbi:hypothetical protein SM007_21110 [Streptomyces avermitilis]|nr:hypothetical protein SM007_21110 [Streptomyces avermitilis]
MPAPTPRRPGESNAASRYPRTLSRGAEGTPDPVSVHDGTQVRSGPYRGACGSDRRLRLSGGTSGPGGPALTSGSTVPWRRAGPAATSVTARRSASARGRSSRKRGQGRCDDFGSRRTYAHDRATGGAERLAVRTHGGNRALAHPPATLLAGRDGRPALLVSRFVPREGSAPGETGGPFHWREL